MSFAEVKHRTKNHLKSRNCGMLKSLRMVLMLLWSHLPDERDQCFLLAPENEAGAWIIWSRKSHWSKAKMSIWMKLIDSSSVSQQCDVISPRGILEDRCQTRMNHAQVGLNKREDNRENSACKKSFWKSWHWNLLWKMVSLQLCQDCQRTSQGSKGQTLFVSLKMNTFNELWHLNQAHYFSLIKKTFAFNDYWRVTVLLWPKAKLPFVVIQFDLPIICCGLVYGKEQMCEIKNDQTRKIFPAAKLFHAAREALK